MQTVLHLQVTSSNALFGVKKSSGVWAGHYFTHSEMGLEQVAFPSASHSCIKAFPGPSILGSVIVFPGHGHQQIWWDLSFHGYGAESFVIYVSSRTVC